MDTSIVNIYIKQHLSNIWSSIHEKVKQHQRSIEKRALVLKKRVFQPYEHQRHSNAPKKQHYVWRQLDRNLLIKKRKQFYDTHYFEIELLKRGYWKMEVC